MDEQNMQHPINLATSPELKAIHKMYMSAVYQVKQQELRIDSYIETGSCEQIDHDYLITWRNIANDLYKHAKELHRKEIMSYTQESLPDNVYNNHYLVDFDKWFIMFDMGEY